MRKTVALTILGLLVAAISIATTAQQAPETIKLDACAAKQPAVSFPHKAHMDRLECGACHHTQKDLTADAAVEVAKCSSCHLNPEKAETPVCTQMSMSKNQFHIGCVGCHKEEAKKNADTKAPTKCAACHVKG